MWKILRTRGRSFLQLRYSQECNRTFLSEAYRCTDAWNERLQSPLLQKVNVDDLFIELDQKFQNQGKASAVDIDIYANVIKGDAHVDELIDVIHKLRLTPEATNILDSTHHAVIRYLFDNNQIEDLLTVLHDRINYGIFPDYACYNMLMDSFIKKKEFGSAARVAVLLMLQEDSDHPISNSLALYSCHKYLENTASWVLIPEPDDPSGEEIKVRVTYIRNLYFDDHFDLREPTELVGKTLVFYGKLMDDVLGRTCYLRGLILWKKYKESIQTIGDWINKGYQECIYSEALPLIQQHIATIPEDKVTDEIKELGKLLEGLDKSSLKEGSILEDIEKRVTKAVDEQAEADISKQLKIYQNWEKTRMNLLEQQLTDLDRKSRLDKVSKMKEDLEKRERLLTFFQNKKKIELAIEEKLKWENEHYGKRVSTAQDIEDNYIPPEIVKNIRSQK